MKLYCCAMQMIFEVIASSYSELQSRVESGLDDPDNLGYFFGGSSGSHPQTKYLDVTSHVL